MNDGFQPAKIRNNFDKSKQNRKNRSISFPSHSFLHLIYYFKYEYVIMKTVKFC